MRALVNDIRARQDLLRVLPAEITLNGVTRALSFIWHGEAGAVASLPARLGGLDLSTVSTGTDPTPGGSSNGLIGIDYNGGKCHEDTTGPSTIIATEDYCSELVAERTSPAIAEIICGTLAVGATNHGFEWQVIPLGGGDYAYRAFIADNGGPGIFATSAAVSAGLHHVGVVADRSKADTTGFQIYVDGVASGAGTAISAENGTLVSSKNFTIGQRPGISSFKYAGLFVLCSVALFGTSLNGQAGAAAEMLRRATHLGFA